MNILIKILIIDECPHECTKLADSMRILKKKYMHISVITLKSTTTNIKTLPRTKY